jgi:macrolide phosphotransferase
VLLDDDGTFTAVLDWTTGRVDDPARDLAAQYGAAGDDMLHATLVAYERAGGHVHPGLAAQAHHLWDASPIAHALYALITRDDAHLAAAAATLDAAPER